MIDRNRMIRLSGVFGAVLLAVGMVFAVADHAWAENEKKDTIYDGISLGTVAVGGMTEEEAEKEYKNYLDDLKGVTVQLDLEDKRCEVDMSDLELEAELDAAIAEAIRYGRTGNILKRYKEIQDVSEEGKSIPVALSLDEDALIELLNEELADYIVPAENAGLEYSDGELTVLDGKNGKELNAEDTIDKLWKAIEEWSGDKKIKLDVAVNELEPEHTAEELAAVKDVIGTFETRYSAGDVSRNNNIMNAANKISSSVIYPGEEFDTMEHLLPFTTANGWSYAGAYLNGEVISDIGGGICQVSTTLYNAVLKAELEVTERYPHSMAVGYVQLSADAALNEGTKNFRFVNNTDAPIFIYAYASGGTMHVSIYGKEYRDENRTIEYVNEVLSVIPAGDPIETVDETKPADYRKVTQTAHTGYRAKLWKKIYEDGELVDTVLVNTSAYNASPERVTVGSQDVPVSVGDPGGQGTSEVPNVPEDPGTTTEAPDPSTEDPGTASTEPSTSAPDVPSTDSGGVPPA